MGKLKKEQETKLKARREVLKAQLRQAKNDYYLRTYEILTELFTVEKKLNCKYTYRKLAYENGYEEQFVYKLLAWRHATPFAKLVVDEKKISAQQVCRIIVKVPRKDIDNYIRFAIEKNLNSREIDRYLTKDVIKRRELMEERVFNNNHNIGRDISTYCWKLKRTLLSIKHLPECAKEEITGLLSSTKENIATALEVLEKKTRR